MHVLHKMGVNGNGVWAVAICCQQWERVLTPNPTGVTVAPSPNPTGVTAAPSTNPTGVTAAPSTNPTGVTLTHSSSPTGVTPAPSSNPTGVTAAPTANPTGATLAPSSSPTGVTLAPSSNPTDNPTHQPTDNPTSQPTECIILQYAGFVLSVAGGFDCDHDLDSVIDARLDNACNTTHPGSRNIRGDEIANNGYLNILGLPATPLWLFTPSCPICGSGCGFGIPGRGRLASGTSSWDFNDGTWFDSYVGTLMNAECVYEISC